VFTKGVPYILVGLKGDLAPHRDESEPTGDEIRTTVSEQMAYDMCQEINAAKYMQVSSVEYVGVRELIQNACQIAHDAQVATALPQKSACAVM
jgi:GTPase SAR1 family protein